MRTTTEFSKIMLNSPAFFDPYSHFQQAAARRGTSNSTRQETTAETEDDDDDGEVEIFVPSPTKRRKARSRSSSTSGSTGSNHRHGIINRRFVCIETSIETEADLEEHVKRHGHEVSAGRGFTHATAGHNAHHERHLPHISVPGEIRALLTHDRLDMPPSRLRSAIRGITLPDGFKVGTLLDARDERAVRLRKGLAKLHKQHLATRRNALMTEGAGNAFGGLSSINYARHRPLGAPTAAGSVRDGEERPRQNSHHRREDDDEDVSRQSRV